MTATKTIPPTQAYAHPDSKSAKLWECAQRVLPGGNSRTTVYMAPRPIYAAEGDGCWITDVDGDRRLDLLNNYTSLIHGHAQPAVTSAATQRLARGASFPLPTSEEIDLAALIVDRVPGIEHVRFTNSGSEAVMMAIKAARGFTGRPKIAKFEGRVPRLVRLGRGESQLGLWRLGPRRCADECRVCEGDAAVGARGGRRVAVQSDRARGGPDRT